MSRRLARIRSGPWVDGFTVDRLLALAFAIAAEAEVAIGDRFASASLVTQATVLATALPIAWRRRSPVVATAVVMAALLTQAAQGGDFLGTTLVAALVCVWSAARHFARTPALASVGVAVAGFWAVATLLPTSGLVFKVGGALWATGLCAATWGVGRAFRTRRLLASELEERAERLQREQEERARLAVADERSRIARELHDIVAHGVSTMVVQAKAGRSVAERDPEQARQAFAAIEGAGRQALTEMRRLLGILRTDGEGLALAPPPSISRLEALLEHVREAGLTVELTVIGEPRPLPSGLHVSAYRIIREALTNALKHAGASRAEVVVRYGERGVVLEVLDDGRGAESAGGNGAGGHGLVGMRERVNLYGGTLEAGSRDGAGYAVRAELPLGPEPS